MVDRSRNRSDRYQWFLLECPCSPESLTEYFDNEHFGTSLTPEQNEKLCDLKEQLRLAFWRIVDTKLTNRQREVIYLCAEGLTQTEIAKKLNVNQSSVTKSLNGNCDYRNGKKIYGGAKKKISKISEKDPEIQQILMDITELTEENWW